jgi:hypothetical protein
VFTVFPEDPYCENLLINREIGLIEEEATKLSSSRVEELVDIFVHATNVSTHTCSLTLIDFLLIKLTCTRWRGDSGTWGCVRKHPSK